MMLEAPLWFTFFCAKQLFLIIIIIIYKKVKKAP